MVEPVGELGEVARQVLGAEVMVRAVQRTLDVAQDRIDPGERRMPGAGRSTSGHERLVKAPGALHRGEAAQGVGHHDGTGLKMAPRIGKLPFGFEEWSPSRRLERTVRGPMYGSLLVPAAAIGVVIAPRFRVRHRNSSEAKRKEHHCQQEFHPTSPLQGCKEASIHNDGGQIARRGLATASPRIRS